MAKEWYKISNELTGTPEINIYGVLTPYSAGDDDDSVSYKDFQDAFRQLEAIYPNCTIRFNCIGGSILEGFPIYDMIKNSPMQVKGIVEGCAASMASVLVLACDDVEINPNAYFMIHKAQGGVFGDADAIKAYADTILEMENRIKAIYVAKTGLPEKTIDGWMASGVDKWINADDAVKFKLANRVVQSAKATKIPIQNFAGKKPDEVYQVFLNSLKNYPINKTEMDKTKATLIVLLATMGINLSANDSDEKFANEVENAFKKKDEAIVNALKDNAEALVDQAIADGKVEATEKESFVAMGSTNPKMLVTMLAKLGAKPAGNAPAGTTIVNIGLDKTKDGQADEKASWTYADYAKKDPKALATMQNTDPEKFLKLQTEFKA
jgi:ATP-dependent Clp protease protease subunit